MIFLIPFLKREGGGLGVGGRVWRVLFRTIKLTTYGYGWFILKGIDVVVCCIKLLSFWITGY